MQKEKKFAVDVCIQNIRDLQEGGLLLLITDRDFTISNTRVHKF